MTSQKPRDFLYLVDSRYEFAEGWLKLQSERSDVLICTFDKKVDHPNFIYKPSPFWAESRNALIEHARRMRHRYKYYVLMNDDVELTRGTFEEFENEVLSIRPDVCTPVYLTNEHVAKQARTLLFRYSTLRHFDCCMVCFGQELFFDDNLLPYHTGLHYTSPVYYRSYYDTVWMWAKLMIDYSDKRILCTSKIWHRNKIISGGSYNHNFRSSMIVSRVYGKNKGKIFYKKMPLEAYYTKTAGLYYRKRQFAKFLGSELQLKHIVGSLSNRRRRQYYLYAYYFRNLGGGIQARILNVQVKFIIMVLRGLWSDIKLNLLLLMNRVKY